MLRVTRYSLIALVALPIQLSFAVDAEIKVTKKDCQRVEKHLARNDVAYKPGVDVHGKPVVPADLDDNRLQLPETIIIDLSLPLQDLYEGAKGEDEKLANAEVQVGKLEYNLSSGKLKFNGQALGDPALNAIAIECRKIYSKKDP